MLIFTTIINLIMEINIKITCCVTEWTYVSNRGITDRLVYAEDLYPVSMSWEDAYQFPLCNYTWSYDYYMQALE